MQIESGFVAKQRPSWQKYKFRLEEEVDWRGTVLDVKGEKIGFIVGVAAMKYFPETSGTPTLTFSNANFENPTVNTYGFWPTNAWNRRTW